MQRASACGKCVLFGEYSILQGGSAITFPLKKLQLEIKFTPQANNELHLNADQSLEVDKIFWKLIEKDFADIPARGKYEIESQIPLGAGLGSSAALSVALHRLHRPGIAMPDLIAQAWQTENFFHGKSSGMDPCTIAIEKALYFKTPNHFEVLETPFFHNPEYIFVLFDSGIRRSTQAGISHTQKIKEEHPTLWRENIETLQSLAVQGKSYLENSQAHSLGQSMNQAHEVLRSWQVSHPELEKLREELLAHQALGVKLTGAGRGGFLVGLFGRTSWRALQARQDASLRSFFEISF